MARRIDSWRMPGWLCVALVLCGVAATAWCDEPPALNPFAPKTGSDGEPAQLNPFSPVQRVRDDAVPGYIQLSDGTIIPGHIYMTRDKRLKIYDGELKRQREIPLRVVKRIETGVLKEWIEKEWRFKELALNEKYYTGRAYPAREHTHRITLHDDRQIVGPMAEIIYLDPADLNADEERSMAETPGASPGRAKKYILHKRDKGDWGETLESLVYVKKIELGEEALEEGVKKAKGQKAPSKTP